MVDDQPLEKGSQGGVGATCAALADAFFPICNEMLPAGYVGPGHCLARCDIAAHTRLHLLTLDTPGVRP
jgi:hypothetical protein